MMDGNMIHSDLSGYSISALAMSSTYGPSLVKGATRSVIVGNAAKAQLVSPVLVQGKEHLPFSLEATFRPLISGPLAEQQVLGRDGNMDGIVVNGTVVSFVTKFLTAPECRASFDVTALQTIHAVGIHTENTNSLYINGELVAETTLTLEQQADRFMPTSGPLVSGTSTSSNLLMVNGFGIYEAVLEDYSIQEHYEQLSAGSTAEEIAGNYGGHLLEFSSAQTNPVFESDFSLDEDWQSGGMFGVVSSDNTLYPENEAGLTLEGHWEIAIPLDADTSLYAGTVSWQGVGVTVQTSRDGSSWTNAENGVNLPTIANGTTSTDQTLFIRVSFAAGLPEYTTFLEQLTFSLYGTSSLPELAGRQVIISKASIEGDYDIKDYHADWGLELRDGTLTIKQGTGSEPMVPKTIEVWARKSGSAVFTDNLYASVSRWRSNGDTGFSYRTDEWQVRHYVYDSGFTGDITFSGTGQIGHVVLYPNALSNEEIKSIYDSYMGAPSVVATNLDVLNIREFPGEVDIYEYDWTIESSG